MDLEQVLEETHKKGRQRRKQTVNTILKQMQFYFSDANLSKDRFLTQKLKESEYVDLGVFLTFNKIAKLTSSIDDIAKAIKKSTFLQLDESFTKVKRLTPLKQKANEDDCIIYVQTLHPDTTHEWLVNVFSEFGKVEYVSIPKYSHNKFAKGFAFIEYENEKEVQSALDYFGSIGGRISLHIDDEELVSNHTYDESGKDDEKITENEADETDKVSGLSRKRKLDESEDKVNVKKLKPLEKSKDVVEEGTSDADGKVRKKSSKRKALIKEYGLQVLTKMEWKKLRNRYWNMQWKKMKQLKQHLNKRRLHRNNYLNVKGDAPGQSPIVKESLKDFTPGVIVKVKLTEPWTDAKKLKNEFKNIDNTIQYVDVPVTLASDEVFLRFKTGDDAQNFCKTNSKGDGVVLTDHEESQYWDKIKTNRDAALNKDVKKQRGRDKLLRRAERELGKHIRFNDDPDD